MTDTRLEKLREALNQEMEKGDWSCDKILALSQELDEEILVHYKKLDEKRTGQNDR